MDRSALWQTAVGVTGDASRPADVYASTAMDLTRLAFLLVGDWSEAEDIVQIVFAEALPRWASLESPTAYLKRAVVNRSADSHRRRLRRRFYDAPKRLEPAPELDELWSLVQALPARSRVVIVLRYYEDSPTSAIAAVLGRPESTIRSDLRRALILLRKDYK